MSVWDASQPMTMDPSAVFIVHIYVSSFSKNQVSLGQSQVVLRKVEASLVDRVVRGKLATF